MALKKIRMRGWKRTPERQGIEPGKRNPNDKSGYVYVVYLGIGILYKIGRTRNITRRLKEMSASNPKLRAIIASRVTNMFKIEKELHREFANFCVDKRECFSLTQEQLDTIQKWLEKYAPPNMIPDYLSART